MTSSQLPVTLQARAPCSDLASQSSFSTNPLRNCRTARSWTGMTSSYVDFAECASLTEFQSRMSLMPITAIYPSTNMRIGRARSRRLMSCGFGISSPG